MTASQMFGKQDHLPWLHFPALGQSGNKEGTWHGVSPGATGALRVPSKPCDLWGLVRPQPHQTPQLGHALTILTKCGRSAIWKSPKIAEHTTPASPKHVDSCSNGHENLQRKMF